MSTISSCVTRFVAVVLVLLLISLSFWFGPPFRRPCGVRKHEKICLMMPNWCEMKNCHARCPARNGPIGGNSETNCERIRNPQGKRRAWCVEKLWHSLLPVLPWIIPKAGKKNPPNRSVPNGKRRGGRQKKRKRNKKCQWWKYFALHHVRRPAAHGNGPPIVTLRGICCCWLVCLLPLALVLLFDNSPAWPAVMWNCWSKFYTHAHTHPKSKKLPERAKRNGKYLSGRAGPSKYVTVLLFRASRVFSSSSFWPLLCPVECRAVAKMVSSFQECFCHHPSSSLPTFQRAPLIRPFFGGGEGVGGVGYPKARPDPVCSVIRLLLHLFSAPGPTIPPIIRWVPAKNRFRDDWSISFSFVRVPHTLAPRRFLCCVRTCVC